MSIGPSIGIIGSAAGSPLSQATGSDVDRTSREVTNQARQVAGERKAEQAAGIGETEQDEGISDRDADGRRLWEFGPDGEGKPNDDSQEGETPHSRDATGTRGNQLDVSG